MVTLNECFKSSDWNNPSAAHFSARKILAQYQCRDRSGGKPQPPCGLGYSHREHGFILLHHCASPNIALAESSGK
jgi:hypothetical protein